MNDKNKLKLAIPKGRLYDELVELLKDAGYKIKRDGRNYRPYISDHEIEVKLFKTQNIPKLVELGSQDIAFTGQDWVVEENADVKEVLNLELSPVKIVAAIPKDLDMNKFNGKKLRVASEYENLTNNFLKKKGIDFIFIRSYGATEVFIPEDADMIVDNTSTGKTLEHNGLSIYETVLESSTRLIANKDSLKDSWKKKKIEDFITLITSVLEAKKRVFIEMNVPEGKVEEILPLLPSMKSPTVMKHYNKEGCAVKIAVKKDEINKLIPLLKKKGITDILVMKIEKVMC